MGTILNKLQRILDTKGSIRDAIISKGQDIPEDTPFASYADKISAISAGTDTADATATPADILQGKTAYAKGAKVTGNIPIKSENDIAIGFPIDTSEPAYVSMSEGYYPKNTQKSLNTQNAPSISLDISSTGEISAAYSMNNGVYRGGSKVTSLQLTTIEAQTIIPRTADVDIPAGLYTTGIVKIKGDDSLVAENIKRDVSIFGVTGSLREYVTVRATVNTTLAGLCIAYLPPYVGDNRWLILKIIPSSGVQKHTAYLTEGSFILFGNTERADYSIADNSGAELFAFSENITVTGYADNKLQTKALFFPKLYRFTSTAAFFNIAAAGGGVN